jgi:hypothetical protein
MFRSLGCALLCGVGVFAASTTAVQGQTTSADDFLLSTLTSHQYDLDGDGLTFLLNEAMGNDFFQQF